MGSYTADVDPQHYCLCHQSYLSHFPLNTHIPTLKGWTAELVLNVLVSNFVNEAYCVILKFLS